MFKDVYPFSAIVGQDQLKLALLVNAVNPAIGGVLIRGEKGTAKSTAVRALADLLPERQVIEDCPFHCDPDHPEQWCPLCRSRTGKPKILRRRVPVVTLPLNAGEERVVGGIDFNRTLRSGVRHLEPGLLARAHRGILYIDEVNLLDDHIVDIILDAAASARNRIEREGISFVHACRFILVGTMNPEEGELRPQFLDRFGLCVEVRAEEKAEYRAEVVMRREAYDLNPVAFRKRYQKADEEIARRIRSARSLLPKVRLAPGLRSIIAASCLEKLVAGHRADLVMEQAARALAALDGRLDTSVDDIRKVAPLCLNHRKREGSPPPTPPPSDHEHRDPGDKERDTSDKSQDDDTRLGENDPKNEPPQQAGSSFTDDTLQEEGPSEESDRFERIAERIFEVGATFRVRKFSVQEDRLPRRGSGRRSRTRSALKQGRYIKSRPHGTGVDVALDATLRAAAPYQLHRRKRASQRMAVILRPEDIREKIREKRIGNFLLFVVDASGSMGARKRMVATKGAVMSLLLDAYQKRDRIALISFRNSEAVVNLPPTSSVHLAATLLRKMPVGGRTPLSAAIVRSQQMIASLLIRDPAARPIVILITDGKANVSLGNARPFEEACRTAETLSRDPRIHCIVVDTESGGMVRFGLAKKLAAAMNADYLPLENLKADTLVQLVKETIQ